jgi:hypothetical protein
MVDPTGTSSTLLQQPQSQTVIEERTASSASRSRRLPEPGEYSIQWLKDGEPIPGATGDQLQDTRF